MSASDIHAERLRFNRIDDATMRILQQLRPVLKKELPGVLDGFYNHLAAFAGPDGLFADDEAKARAKGSRASTLVKTQRRRASTPVKGEK